MIATMGAMTENPSQPDGSNSDANTPPAGTSPPPGETPLPGDTPPTATPPRFELHSLRRSSDDRIIAGVCGGLGRYTGIDPVVFRVTIAVLAIFGGAGLLLYALAWLIVPDDTSSQSEAHRLLRADLLRGHNPLALVGALLVGVLGIVAFVNVAHRGWPGPTATLIAVAALVALLTYRHGWSQGSAAPPTSAAPPPPTNAPLGPPAGFAPSRPAATAEPDEPSPFAMPPSPAPRPPRSASMLTPIALSLSVLLTGLLLGFSASGVVDLSLQGVVAAALLVVGLALVAGTWIGRGRGLIAIGALLAVALTLVAAVDVPLRGGVGNRVYAPTGADVHPDYRLGIGNEELDLTDAALDGSVRHIDATVGIGQLHVDVLESAKLVIHATTGAGSLQINGVADVGTHLERDVTIPATGDEKGELDLDVHVGMGSVVIDRSVKPTEGGQALGQDQAFGQRGGTS